MSDVNNFASQTRQRLTAMLAMLEKDKISLSTADPDVARSGLEVYQQFIDEVRRGLDNVEQLSETTGH